MKKRAPVRFYLLIFGIPALLGTALLPFLFRWHWTAAWLISANVSALLLWAWDKFQARRRGWRVPERALHAMSLLGATPAALIGMKLFRHKTLKPVFAIGYLVLFLVQLAIVYTLTAR